MDAVKTVQNLDWIDQGARKVMGVLNNGQDVPAALFVGGCVRNAVMGRGATDIDIATMLVPDHVTAVLEDAGVKVIPTGLDHGTVTALIDGAHYEITTLRRDVETTGRHAVVAFTHDWYEDAMRRDFTMNTLLCDTEGRVFDPVGTGLEDALAGRVIFVGTAEERIQEDYLRILRFFRFHAVYGQGAPDADAIAACKAHADQLATLSKERIAQEFLKIVAVNAPATVLDLMQNANILPALFDKAYDPQALERLAALQHEHNAIDIVTRLVVLGGLKGEMRAVFADTMTLSNKNQKRYEDILSAYQKLEDGQDVKIVIYRMGHDVVRQALLLQAAIHGGETDMVLCDTWQVPVFPVSGEDLMGQGIAQGPEIGRIMRTLEEYWIQNDFAPDKTDLLARIKE